MFFFKTRKIVNLVKIREVESVFSSEGLKGPEIRRRKECKIITVNGAIEERIKEMKDLLDMRWFCWLRVTWTTPYPLCYVLPLPLELSHMTIVVPVPLMYHIIKKMTTFPQVHIPKDSATSPQQKLRTEAVNRFQEPMD